MGKGIIHVAVEKYARWIHMTAFSCIPLHHLQLATIQVVIWWVQFTLIQMALKKFYSNTHSLYFFCSFSFPFLLKRAFWSYAYPIIQRHVLYYSILYIYIII
uniref:Uncharacterized protein n=1 Tax=Setaria viridis TaxID=4556 RepID=A0A4U6TMJ2_SETVI|nr:hypothetical protein SEVIR_7G073200v2 [Setaria viridis]